MITKSLTMDVYAVVRLGNVCLSTGIIDPIVGPDLCLDVNPDLTFESHVRITPSLADSENDGPALRRGADRPSDCIGSTSGSFR